MRPSVNGACQRRETPSGRSTISEETLTYDGGGPAPDTTNGVAIGDTVRRLVVQKVVIFLGRRRDREQMPHAWFVSVSGKPERQNLPATPIRRYAEPGSG